MTNSNDYLVEDHGTQPNYFTQIPNIIFELGLDPHAITLYLYYKKVAGDNGFCYQKKETISENCGMGRSTIKSRNNILSQPFEELGGKPLIKITQRKGEDGNNLPTLVELTDIWPENIKILSTRFLENRPSVAKKPTLGRQKTTEEEPIQEEPNNNNPTSSAPSEVAPTAVVVFSCLDKLNIPHSIRVKLSKEHKEPFLRDCVDKTLAVKNRDSDLAVLYYVIKNYADWQSPIDKEQIKKSDQEFLEKVYKGIGVKFCVWSVELGNGYLEFTLGSQAKTFYAGEKGMQKELSDFIKKCREVHGRK